MKPPCEVPPEGVCGADRGQTCRHDALCFQQGLRKKKKKTDCATFLFFLYVVGAVLQVDGSPPACSQISSPPPKSTEEEAEQRLPIFTPGAANARSDLVSEQRV